MIADPGSLVVASGIGLFDKDKCLCWRNDIRNLDIRNLFATRQTRVAPIATCLVTHAVGLGDTDVGPAFAHCKIGAGIAWAIKDLVIRHIRVEWARCFQRQRNILFGNGLGSAGRNAWIRIETGSGITALRHGLVIVAGIHSERQDQLAFVALAISLRSLELGLG